MTARIIGVALISVILSVLLSELGFRGRGLFSALCSVLLLTTLIEPISSLISSLTGLSDMAGISEAAGCAVRAVGLGYVWGFTTDFCSSLGEGGIAATLAIIGRVQIFMVAYPFFEKTIRAGVELLG